MVKEDKSFKDSKGYAAWSFRSVPERFILTMATSAALSSPDERRLIFPNSSAQV